ncbi:MAG: hypothetical protein BWY76_03277 [bacterium ADurb.Bin429]|nr:MAG: hypothetical protein BWY76_03277 [bacterium ADurb.Bin429]
MEAFTDAGKFVAPAQRQPLQQRLLLLTELAGVLLRRGDALRKVVVKTGDEAGMAKLLGEHRGESQCYLW